MCWQYICRTRFFIKQRARIYRAAHKHRSHRKGKQQKFRRTRRAPAQLGQVKVALYKMIKLQVKIILWIFIISTRFLCGAQIENINSNERLAFEDFLRVHNLKHALVLLASGHDETGVAGRSRRIADDYGHLLANYRVQFFTSKMSINFAELFYYEAPRTAVFVPWLEDVTLPDSVYRVASREGYFNQSQAWFMLGTSQGDRTDESIIELHMSPYKISIDADITVAMRRNKFVAHHTAYT